MKNIWEILCNKDITRTLFMLGCDPKYINGEASDFECFREWCAACSRLSRNKTAERFAEAISHLIGEKMSVENIADSDAAILWTRCNAELNEGVTDDHFCAEKYKAINAYTTKFLCDEKINNLVGSISLNDLLKKGCNEFDDIIRIIANIGEKAFFVTFEKDEFCRPDRYHAEREYNKYINDEKCNINLMITQLICEIYYSKNQGKIQLIIDLNSENIDYVNEFFSYLIMRRFDARVFLLTHGDIAVEGIVEMCASGNNNVFITACLSENDDVQILEKLSRIYPRDAISVIDDM